MIGILHLSSSVVHLRNGKICKPFTSLLHEKYLISTQKTTKIDIYCIIDVDSLTVKEYIGEIPEKNIEQKMLYMAVKTNHLNSFNKKIDRLEEDLDSLIRIPRRELEFYSIDPPNCKDIDDCFGYNKETNSIHVVIADPTSWIQENSSIDVELSKRVESSYYDKEPYHMLPEGFLNKVSLFEGMERRGFEVVLKFNSNDKLENVYYNKVLFRVKKNLTYDDNIFLIEDLKRIYEIGEKNKYTEEYNTHEMVANIMIMTNYTVAKTITQYDDKKALTREHQGTDDIIKDIKIDPTLYKHYINSKYKSAQYTFGEIKEHFGLKLDVYTTFTSPMRRYADMIVHRQLRKYMTKQKITEIDKKTIEHLNYTKKIYKFLERYNYMLSIIDKIPKTTIKAFVINIGEKDIKIYIPLLNLEWYVKKQIELKLFEEIEINIIINNYDPQKIIIHVPKYQESIQERIQESMLYL